MSDWQVVAAKLVSPADDAPAYSAALDGGAHTNLTWVIKEARSDVDNAHRRHAAKARYPVVHTAVLDCVETTNAPHINGADVWMQLCIR